MWMWRVRYPYQLLRRSPAARSGQAVYSQNRDGYEAQQCGWGGGGSEVWLHARVLCECEAVCDFLADLGAGSGEHEDKQNPSRRCCVPILGGVIGRPRGGVPPKDHGLGKRRWGMCDHAMAGDTLREVG